MTIAKLIALLNDVPKDMWKDTKVVCSFDGKNFFSPAEQLSGVIDYNETTQYSGRERYIRPTEAFALFPEDVYEVEKRIDEEHELASLN